MSTLEITHLNSKDSDFNNSLKSLLNRDDGPDSQAEKIEKVVADIIRQVRLKGDEAVFAYTKDFDGFDPNGVEVKGVQNGIEVSKQRLKKAYDIIPKAQREALEYAAERVRTYHHKQKQSSWQYQEADGNRLGQKITAIKSVGLYVPGGKAAYPSSVLMNAVPAKVAGVGELIMVSPTPKGKLNDLVLAAAYIAGVDRVFTIGGAQAVAALAYGTQIIPAVDKIVGPGNAYVATAKKQVFGKVGIDMIAGPSEVLVIADETVNPDWVAMDLFAQAEHDEMAQSILLSQSQKVLDKVEASINRLLPSMERAEIISSSLKANGALILAASEQSIIDIADTIAAEHLEIFTDNAEVLADKISHAGAMFIGQYSAESLGDYCAGPNHVLPTSGTARFSSPLGVYDFQKRTSIIHCSEKGAQKIGATASVMARGESLTAHARSAEYRMK